MLDCCFDGWKVPVYVLSLCSLYLKRERSCHPRNWIAASRGTKPRTTWSSLPGYLVEDHATSWSSKKPEVPSIVSWKCSAGSLKVGSLRPVSLRSRTCQQYSPRRDIVGRKSSRATSSWNCFPFNPTVSIDTRFISLVVTFTTISTP